jgi:hypothetical protein
MSLIRGMLGHATDKDTERLAPKFEPFLVEGEEILRAYKIIRDYFVFTDKRLILVDRQGISGRKTEFMSIPYHSIVRFSKESAGLLDLEAELKIWVRGQEAPIVREFSKNSSVNEVYRVLSAGVLG